MLLLLLLPFLFLRIECLLNVEEQTDYWEKLINEGVLTAQRNDMRKDNSDFFQNLTAQPPKDYGTFDFIVVGGGTAGSALATRLTEVEKWKVLLLEAGDLDDDLIYMPFLFAALYASERNWGFMTTPQEPYACLGRKNSQCAYPKGKLLGGSSGINAMIWNRGTPDDYNEWEKLGNPGWSWDHILPLYKKIENFQSDCIDTNYRGFGGPINTAYTKPFLTKEFESFRKSNEKFGIPYVEDFQAKNMIGVSKVQLNTNHGRRVTAASGYVRPNWHRHNFHIVIKAFATKILIDSSKRATGVEFIRNGIKYVARASKEVVLSAGAANSPQLLMLSGIGPASELKKHHIKLVKDLPVGKYLKDHPLLMLSYETNNKVEPKPMRALIQEFLYGKGPLTNFNNIAGVTLVNLKDKKSKSPDIQIIFDPNDRLCQFVPGQLNEKDDVAEELARVRRCGNWVGEVFLLHPKSSGTLTLQSSDPKDFPLINVGQFVLEEDVEVVYQGVKLMNKMLLDMPFNVTIPKLSFCSDHKFDSKAYWYCVIRSLTYPICHICGTTKMGPRNDSLAVVDHKLKVYGIQGLRVADTGIMPDAISGNHVAPAYVIGEKAAELIKEEYLKH